MIDIDSRKGKRNGVSRRSFVKVVGTSGVAVGFAGCVSTGGGDGDNGGSGSSGGGDSDTSTSISTEETTEDIIVKIAGDTRTADSSDAIVQPICDARFPDNISIDIIAGPRMIDDRQAWYQQWLGGGCEEPTPLMIDSEWTIPFIVRNQLQNFSESLPSEMISTIEDKYLEASISTAKGSNDNLYGVPLLSDFPTMQYRKDLLRSADYTDGDFDTWATESMSWGGLSKVTKETLDVNGVRYSYMSQADVYGGLSYYDFNELMTSYGGAFLGDHDNLFGSVGKRPVTADEQSVLDFIWMVHTFTHGEDDEYTLNGTTGGIASEAVLRWIGELPRKPLTGDDAIMHRSWSYLITINGTDDAFDEDLGAMPIPYGVPADEAGYRGTGGLVAAPGGWHMTMNPNAPRQQKQAGAQVLEVMMKS